MSEHSEVSQLLLNWSQGDTSAHDHLMPLVYGELRRLAAFYLRQERAARTLQPTALVHEAYMRLMGDTVINWQNRGHFFALAAQAMRRVLVDHARTKCSLKRGGGVERITFVEDLHHSGMSPDKEDVALLDLEEALEALEHVDARLARLVELRYFAGLTIEETALAMESSPATVKRDWIMAKAWLHARLTVGV